MWNGAGNADEGTPSMRWYWHSPDKWLGGTRGMTFEQKGLHADLISIYIDRNGNLPDDDELLIRILCCRPQVWRRLKAELLKIQKLRAINGRLVPNGCETSLKLARNFAETQSLRAKNPRNSTAELSQGRLALLSKKDIYPSLTHHLPPREEPKKESKDLKINGGASPAGQLPPGREIPNYREIQKKDHQAEKDAKRRKARQAWEAALAHQLGADNFADAIDILANNPRLADQITDAELRQPGNGALNAPAAILNHMRKAS
jgi:uncharacterized protein YdaU (DUF1376 family)